MKAKMVYVIALALVFSLVSVTIPGSPALAATITVTNTNDSGAGSLRQAIADSAPGGTIDFSVTGNITLANQLTIDKNLTIIGPGAASLAISGDNTYRVFEIGISYTVNMSAMTIRNGNGAGGGGILNRGTLTLTSCNVSGNTAIGNGGGIDNYEGTLTLTSCNVSGNTASGNGGGVYSYSSTLTMTNCTVSGNTAGSSGGGVYSHTGGLTITNCNISGNTATTQRGGGIFVYNAAGTVAITNCTVSGDTSGQFGGGIYSYGSTVTITNCTVSGNTAESFGSGGIYSQLSTMTLTCTIVHGNTADPYPNINAATYTGSANIVDNPDPLLGPLQDNGGPTFTRALGNGSPAIDGCTGGNCTVLTDQRGISRPQGDECDIGAYEVGTNNAPNQPTNILPADGATDISLIPTLNSSAFSDPDAGDTHAASQWQITTTAGDYSSPVFDSGIDGGNLTSITIPGGILNYSTTYWWHVGHRDNNDAWSGNSTETSFVTGTCCGDVDSATGTGNTAFCASSGIMVDLTAVSEGALSCPVEVKPNLDFIHGFFSFNVTGLTPSQTVTINITLPQAVPVGTQYWKCHNNTWVNVTSLLGDDDGDNVLTLTITDGGLGDADGAANGVIEDPGAPGQPEIVLIVGGEVYPVNRVAILAPWIGLMSLVAVAMAVVLVAKRRHVA